MKNITFKMAVYKYACHKYDNYGQSMNGYYPLENCSTKNPDGSWILRDTEHTYCKVFASGKVIT